MMSDLWPAGLRVLFVDAVVTQLADEVGFSHVHPRDRFWELLALGSITPEPILTAKEKKALVEGQKEGSVSEPVKLLFIEKKSGQLKKLGIGMTDLNRRQVAVDEKDKAARPTDNDVASLIGRAGELKPLLVAFVVAPDLFVDLMKKRFPEVTPTPGLQPFRIGTVEVWLLGSTTAVLRGESLASQEDAFFALGERLEGLDKPPEQE